LQAEPGVPWVGDGHLHARCDGLDRPALEAVTDQCESLHLGGGTDGEIEEVPELGGSHRLFVEAHQLPSPAV
jgi:hypothetical protein